MTQDSDAPFAHVLSFGSCCLVARILRDIGLRLYAGPFDWIYSSAQMVRHCISDDFSTFLDLDQLIGLPPDKARVHDFYGKMMNRTVVFPHHEPRGKDRSYYKRNVQRFLKVLASPERKLFVLVHLVQSQEELHGTRSRTVLSSTEDDSGSSNAEVGRLFDQLNLRGVINFELCVVHAVEPGLDERINANEQSTNSNVVYDTGPGCERLIVHELHCVGRFTGLYFKRFIDEKSLKQLMLGSPFEKHSFKLQPDPFSDCMQLRPWQTTAMEVLPATTDCARQKLWQTTSVEVLPTTDCNHANTLSVGDSHISIPGKRLTRSFVLEKSVRSEVNDLVTIEDIGQQTKASGQQPAVCNQQEPGSSQQIHLESCVYQSTSKDRQGRCTTPSRRKTIVRSAQLAQVASNRNPEQQRPVKSMQERSRSSSCGHLQHRPQLTPSNHATQQTEVKSSVGTCTIVQQAWANDPEQQRSRMIEERARSSFAKLAQRQQRFAPSSRIRSQTEASTCNPAQHNSAVSSSAGSVQVALRNKRAALLEDDEHEVQPTRRIDVDWLKTSGDEVVNMVEQTTTRIDVLLTRWRFSPDRPEEELEEYTSD